MSAAKSYKVSPGRRFPQGATVEPHGVNFSVFCRHATWVELNLYESADAPAPFQVIRLDPNAHRTFFTWHVFVEGLAAGVWYTYRVDGPTNTRETGFRHNANKELLDPWAKTISDTLWDRARARRPEERSPSMRALVVDDAYDWDGDRPLDRRFEETVIYELHVGGFTRHPSAGVRHPGTFEGLIEKVPYLKDLGITDVELMPIMAFDPQDVPEGPRRRGLSNFWGYSTHSFFSPHPGYCVTPDAGTHRREFKDLVRALHRAGIGVILDVV
jgi:isoamylase